MKKDTPGSSLQTSVIVTSSYLGVPGLGLAESERVDVTKRAFNEGNRRGMQLALNTWIRKHTYKTYRSLVEILLELEQGDLANKVCKNGKSESLDYLPFVTTVLVLVLLVCRLTPTTRDSDSDPVLKSNIRRRSAAIDSESSESGISGKFFKVVFIATNVA